MEWNKFCVRNRLVSRIKGLEEQSRILRLRAKKAEAKEKSSWQFRNFKRLIGKEARHHLLAYALIKGIPYNTIEVKCRENNKPNADAIFKIMSSVYFIGSNVSESLTAHYFNNEWNIEIVKKWLGEIEEQKIKNTIETVKELKKISLFHKLKSLIVGE